MKSCVFLGVVFAISGTSAWLFGRNEETTATADGRLIDDGCEQLGLEGSCDFFDCFEQRLPCGREWYMRRIGGHYCNRFVSAQQLFTPEGQEFLERAQQCITERLLPYYRRDYLNCHDLEHDAVDMVSPCYLDNGFCDIFEENSDAFMEVFEVEDLFRSGAAKLWDELYDLASTCGTRAVRRFMEASASRISSPLRRFLGLFRSGIKEIHTGVNNIRSEVEGLF